MARSAGVAEAKLDAIQRDTGAVDDSVFDAADLLAVRLADSLLEEQRVEPVLWKQVVDAWGEAGVLITASIIVDINVEISYGDRTRS